jgi:hypothetical protein
VLNLETTTSAVFATLVTDVALLLIMLIGLLRIRLDAGGAFALSHILWKQVLWSQVLLAVIIADLLMSISVCKGLIWLFVATSAEVPSTVCLDNLLHPFILLIVILTHRCSCF